jgi:hypothetical protein
LERIARSGPEGRMRRKQRNSVESVPRCAAPGGSDISCMEIPSNFHYSLRMPPEGDGDAVLQRRKSCWKP